MKRSRAHSFAASALAAVFALGFGAAEAQGDPQAAEQQYRVARRLVAEGSPDAATALQRVIDLDPNGALADDALVEQATLLGVARWPEELGRIDSTDAARAAPLLKRVLTDLPASDRADEARLLYSLLRMEPLPLRDVSAARLDLLTVAVRGSRSEFGGVARYTLGNIDEIEGDVQRAHAAYQRLLLEDNRSVPAARARVGLARMLLRGGEYGRAASLLQEAVELKVDPATRARSLRELALRSLLRAGGAGGEWRQQDADRFSTGVRDLTAMVRLPDDGVVFADRKNEKLIRLDRSGQLAGEWELDAAVALAVDGLGRLFAADEDTVFRLLPEGRLTRVASLEDYGPVSSLTADHYGRLWVSDRRGSRVGRLDLGATEFTEVWQSKPVRATQLAWDGRRLLALDARNDRLFAIGADGTETTVAPGLQVAKPIGMTVDPAGHCYVLDARAGAVTLVDRNGRVVARAGTAALGAAKPAGFAVGADGSLDLFDASSGVWRRVR